MSQPQPSHARTLRLACVFAVLPCLTLVCGCRDDALPDPSPSQPKPVVHVPDPPAAKPAKLGPGVYLETRGQGKTARRRLLVDARVCRRDGSFGLETFLCRTNSKEHESIVSTDADARLIHAGLLAAGAKPGHPVRFFEDKPPETPTGTPIQVSVYYKDGGKEHTVRAQEWILNVKTKKPLAQDWVFAGSILWKDPEKPKAEPIYVANEDGAYICVNNVPTAMLDLPIKSDNRPEDRTFGFNTAQIPPIGTKVTLILEPKK